ncbi:MAG: hypothetical protein LBR80_00595 [Deltaproteobacteria bacterium]|jgi:peptidoglycan/LPS O-acetylase OafA/YrhL|nr:hypothetical protein [Deltaproteobacteria bacterium]
MPDFQEQTRGLGGFLAAQLAPERIRIWRIVFFLALAVAALLNLVVPNHHPHFGVDRYPFFWPVFGLAVGVVMVFVVKKIVQPLIRRPEDHYGDV